MFYLPFLRKNQASPHKTQDYSTATFKRSAKHAKTDTAGSSEHSAATCRNSCLCCRPCSVFAKRTALTFTRRTTAAGGGREAYYKASAPLFYDCSGLQMHHLLYTEQTRTHTHILPGNKRHTNISNQLRGEKRAPLWAFAGTAWRSQGKPRVPQKSDAPWPHDGFAALCSLSLEARHTPRPCKTLQSKTCLTQLPTGDWSAGGWSGDGCAESESAFHAELAFPTGLDEACQEWRCVGLGFEGVGTGPLSRIHSGCSHMQRYEWTLVSGTATKVTEG